MKEEMAKSAGSKYRERESARARARERETEISTHTCTYTTHTSHSDRPHELAASLLLCREFHQIIHAIDGHLKPNTREIRTHERQIQHPRYNGASLPPLALLVRAPRAPLRLPRHHLCPRISRLRASAVALSEKELRSSSEEAGFEAVVTRGHRVRVLG